MRRAIFVPCWVLLLLLWVGCVPSKSFQYNFEPGAQGWDHGFADYPQDQDASRFQFEFAHRALPSSVPGSLRGLFIQGQNLSDDLFMFIKRKLTGLRPNLTYRVFFRVQIATNVPSNCVGIGGPPGESVYVKAGAMTTEPVAIVRGNNYRMNVDKGNQSAPGKDAIVIGNIANGLPCDQPTSPYRLKTLTNRSNPFYVQTDAYGEVWILIGTDSGFEGTTAIYYNSVQIDFVRLPGDRTF